jgi:uncharacterized protein YbbK (DUF523 family)/mannose-6-phosphate isomerase-like protein (cupin superfamily)
MPGAERPAPVLVSACLLGERVRHDGRHARAESGILARWLAEGRVVSFCPELAAGLGVPRPAAEIRHGRVADRDGNDLTGAFVRGAEAALAAARAAGARVALLKDGSPSCGSSRVHDGSFAGRRVPGEGLTTALLRRAGVRVFGEGELEAADAWLRGLDHGGASMPEKVNLAQKLSLFSEHWKPHIVGEVNGCQMKLVKFQGPFDWHFHAAEDEAFLVVAGRFRMEFRDRSVPLEAGEMIVVPHGVEHRPVADEEAHVLLFEPSTTLNTGNVRTARTRDTLERI